MKITTRKTFFTLLFTVGSLTSVVAQRNNDNKNNCPGREENSTVYNSKNNNDSYYKSNDQREYAYHDGRFSKSFPMSSRERDFLIQKINGEYHYKIKSVTANRYMRPFEKRIEIRSLENQRHYQIVNIQLRYSNNRNR